MRRYITPAEETFIRENYPSRGSHYCAKELGISALKIQRCANERLGIHLNPGMQSEVTRLWAAEYNRDNGGVRINMFHNITCPNVAYFLGFLWADGHVEKRTNRISLKVRLDDGQAIMGAFNTIATFSITANQATTGTRNNKASLSIRVNNSQLRAFLGEYGYLGKSGGSPDKILSHIPEHLRHYWWRGYFDGDGHVYLSPKTNTLGFASTFEQDWGFTTRLMTMLGVARHKITRYTTNRGHKSSSLIIQNMVEIHIVLSYIYQGFETDRIGLPRKHDKFLALKAKMTQSRYHRNRLSIEGTSTFSTNGVALSVAQK